VVLVVPVIIGGALMSFLSRKNQGGLLTGIYMINCVSKTNETRSYHLTTFQTTAILVIVYSWVSSNVAGYTKKVSKNPLY
jgi:hypothetical protein